MTETIGERLRRLRTERGLSQRELSSPGVSYAYISRIEAGARRPSVKALRMLARKLGISAEYLETGSEISSTDARELRLADAELRLRLEGATADAADELHAILDDAVADGDLAAATRSRIALGLSAHERGAYAEAAELLETALDGDRISPIARPDAYASLGHAYNASGRSDRAVLTLQHALDRIRDEAPEDAVAQVRFASYLSSALTDAGDAERAREVLEDALGTADDIGDGYTRIRILWGLGRLAMNESQPLTALDYFRRAIALLEATDDTLHLGRAYLSCATALIEGGRPEEAGQSIARASRLFGGTPEALDLVMLRTLQARRALALRDANGALTHAREALAIAGDAHPHERGHALLTLAQAQAARGDAGAESAFGTAAAHIDDYGPQRLRPDAYRGWARLLRAQGRESEALDLLERATDPVNVR